MYVLRVYIPKKLYSQVKASRFICSHAQTLNLTGFNVILLLVWKHGRTLEYTPSLSTLKVTTDKERWTSPVRTIPTLKGSDTLSLS